jgi:hypothetical protein
MQLFGHFLTLKDILFVLQEQYTAQLFAFELLVPSSEELLAAHLFCLNHHECVLPL